MPRMYPVMVRRQIVARLRSGEPVAVVAAETGVCQATLFRWKRQALIDAGVIEGIPSVEADELAAAHKRNPPMDASPPHGGPVVDQIYAAHHETYEVIGYSPTDNAVPHDPTTANEIVRHSRIHHLSTYR